MLFHAFLYFVKLGKRNCSPWFVKDIRLLGHVSSIENEKNETDIINSKISIICHFLQYYDFATKLY